MRLLLDENLPISLVDGGLPGGLPSGEVVVAGAPAGPGAVEGGGDDVGGQEGPDGAHDGHGENTLGLWTTLRAVRTAAVELTGMRGIDIARRIERLGGELVRQRGSHRRYRVALTDEDGVTRTAFTTVPMHNRDMPIKTQYAIQRDLDTAFGKGWLL